MLWRQHYETRVLRDLQNPLAPSPIKQVWIASFAFEGIQTQEVWWKLINSDFRHDERVRKVFIVESLDPSTLATIESLMPPSEAGRVQTIEDEQRIWQKLIQPGEHRAFAAIVEDDRIPLLMVGPPTEDAWEAFSQEWRTKT